MVSEPDNDPAKRPRKRFSARLLAADAFIDTTVWRIGDWLSRTFSGYARFMRRFRLRGPARGANELLSEVFTLGMAGAVVMLAFALPAFEETREDWRATADYSITILDRYGKEVGKRGMLLDDSVPLEELPDYLVKAALATEDRRFFDHFGIDVIGTFRALLENVRARTVVQGGSSITQQLAKNLFLSNERTLQRKIKEAFLAMWLEANLTKRDILKLYLDRAYMGGGAFGVGAASKFYFNKSVKDISLPEAAMLAGLFKAPTRYAPHIDLPAARARANEVLSNMVEAGFMTEGQVIGARRNPASVVDRSKQELPDYFLDFVFDEIKRIAPGPDHVLTVKSTLDVDLQKTADEAVESSLRQYGRPYGVKQAAMVVVEPDGALRAIVGGRDYDSSQFNRATDALRQPGSSFKPFVYMTAFMHGFSPKSVVRDGPITIGHWSPRNYGRSYSGPVTLTNALVRSINTIPVRLSLKIGRKNIIETAKRMGIRSELRNDASLPIGTSEVTAIDMAGAYAVIANGGRKATPYAIQTILNSSGDVVWERERDGPRREQVMPPDKVHELAEILTQVVERGTGRRARLEGILAGGKTGTTQAYRDAWFIGFTGNYVASVWFGNDDYTSTRRLTGGSLPAMTWNAFMKVAHANVKLKAMPGFGDNADEPGQDPALVASGGDGSGEGTLRNFSLPQKSREVLAEIERLMRENITRADSRQAVLKPMRVTGPGMTVVAGHEDGAAATRQTQ
ncbi:transglycosylase domain-containing protein [Rhodobium orientis]|uniref:transglycosylase domain-containing protein n=1 Tax=Rhodobium orientis TaxID=34017 RepID=UPI003B830625